MKGHYRVYAKTSDMKRFKAVDVRTGNLVTNLIHATIIPAWQLEELKNYIEEVKQDQPELEFKIEKIK